MSIPRDRVYIVEDEVSLSLAYDGGIVMMGSAGDLLLKISPVLLVRGRIDTGDGSAEEVAELRRIRAVFRRCIKRLDAAISDGATS